MSERTSADGSGQARASSDTEPTQGHSGGGQQASGEQVTGQATGPSFTDYLSRPDIQHQIKYIIGIFAIVGLGFGLTGYVFTDVLISGTVGSSESSGSFAGAIFTAIAVVGVMVMAALTGTIISVFTTRGLSDRFDEVKSTYVTAAVGNGVGYLVMMVLTTLILSVTLSTGGSSSGSSSGSASGSGGSLLSLGDILVPLIALAIPVVIVSVATVYLEQRMRYPGLQK